MAKKKFCHRMAHEAQYCPCTNVRSIGEVIADYFLHRASLPLAVAWRKRKEQQANKKIMSNLNKGKNHGND